MRIKTKALVAVVLILSASAYSQQITRVAVIDLPRVISTYNSQSKEVRDFEAKKAKVQADIDRMSSEITALLNRKAEADKAGDKTLSASIKSEIDQRTRTLNDYVNVKQAELDAEAARLLETDLFTQELYKKIQSVAEYKGYSLVLNIKGRDQILNSVLWYSPMIDITNDVIQALGVVGQ
jgi:outer membrane protein